MIRSWIVAVFAAWLARPDAALAQSNIAALLTGETGMSIEEVSAIFRDAGLSANVSATPQGAPVIDSQINGYKFSLFAYECDRARRCAEFMFQSVFQLRTSIPVARMNEFNAGAIAGRAYINDGNAYIEHFFSVSNASDRAIVRQNIATWREVLESFVNHIGLQKAAS